MRPIIVDTNILFSALRSPNAKIREILDRNDLYFYMPNFLIVEIFRHKEKILQKTSADPEDVYEFLNKMTQKITFVNEGNISLGNLVQAYRLCQDIDEKDTPFVALTLEMEGEFWTRDEVLRRGLQKKGFISFFEEKEVDIR